MRTDIDGRLTRGWGQDGNRFGWRSYLAALPDGDVPALAAPARCNDLSGLPPAWIGVGTNDLFHDEDVTYAEALRTAGVPCTLDVVRGGYDGFELTQSWTNVAQAFRQAQLDALAHAFGGALR